MCPRLDHVPELDPPRGHETRLDVRIGLGELLGHVRIRGAEDERPSVRGITEGTRHHDPVIAANVGQVGLPVGTSALEDVVDVVVEENVMSFWHRRQAYALARYALLMADLQKRGGYTPRRAREQRAYRLVVTGGVAGVVGVVGLVLAIAGVIGATLPVIALIIAAICVVLFRQTTQRR